MYKIQYNVTKKRKNRENYCRKIDAGVYLYYMG